MSSVDDRIVNMQFNNKQFTQGAAESQKSLESLEKTLTNTAKGQGLTTMGAGVDGIRGKFSAMQVAGVAAIATIASKATAVGLNFIKSFTLDPIKAGFSEYQTNLNSVQTIMANTGATVKTVNKYLNELNHYSDQTIYNFSEMARNIGTFTAAGVQLKEATSAIKGIANLAALSGSNSQQASTAMYQLSQAIAAGRVNLQDWNSVVNAGMGGKQFQTALAQTAVAMGGLDKNVITLDKSFKVAKIAGESFRESISAKPGSQPWLTSDVLVKTLASLDGRFSATAINAQRTSKGLTSLSDAQIQATLQTRRANFEAQNNVKYTNAQFKEVTKMADAAFKSATQVKTLPQLMGVVRESLGSIWSSVFSGILGNFTQSVNLWTKVGDVVQGITRKINQTFTDMVNEWASLGGRLNIINGFGAIFKDLGKIFVQVRAAWKDVFPPTSADGIHNITKAFRMFVTNLYPSLDTLHAIRSIFGGIFAVLHIGVTIVKAVASVFTSFFGEIFKHSGETTGGILEFAASLGEMLKKLDKFITSGGKMVDVFSNFGKAAGVAAGAGLEIASNFIFGIVNGIVGGAAISSLQSAMVDMASNMVEWVKNALGIHSPAQELVPVGENVVKGIAEGIVNGLTYLIGAMGEVIGAIFDAIGNLFGGMDALDFASVLNAIFAGGLLLTLNKGIGTFANFADKIEASMTILRTSVTDTFKQMQQTLKAQALLAIAIAIGILVASLIALQFVDPAKLGAGIGAIATLMAIMVASFAMMSKIGSSKDMMGEQVLTGSQNIATMAAAMLVMATSIAILTGAVTVLAQQDPKKLGAGMGFLAGMLALMVGSLLALSKMEGPAAGAAGAIFIMATSMNILVVAVTALGLLPFDVVAQGLGAMAIGLAIMVAAALGLSLFGDQAAKGAAAILIMSTAMVVLAAAVGTFGSMDMKTLAKGFGAIAVGLLLFVAVLLVLSPMAAQVSLVATSILIMSAAMLAMAVAIGILGQMDGGAIAKGLLAIAGGFAIILLAAAAAIYVAPGLLVLAVALQLMGGALLAAGAGMFLFATGLAIFVAVGTASIAIITLAFQAFMALLPSFAMQIAAAFVTFIETIAKASPRISAAMTKIFNSMLDVVINAIPKIQDLIQALIDAAIETIRNTVPQWIEAGIHIIVKFLEGIADNIDDVIQAGTDIIVKIIEGLGNAAEQITTAAGETLLKIANAFDAAVVEYLPRLQKVGLSIAGHILDGLTGGLASKVGGAIKDGLGSVGGAVGGLLGKAGLTRTAGPRKASKTEGLYFGAQLVQGVANGISRGQISLVDAVIRLANAIQTGGQKGLVPGAVQAARNSSIAADRAQARADSFTLASTKVPKGPKRKALLAKADRAQSAADRKQTLADEKQALAERERQFAESDNGGKAELRAEDATIYADKAQAMLAKADAESARAQELMKTNRKAGRAMLAQARKDAAAARALATKAKKAYDDAQRFYLAEVTDRIEQLEADRKADEEARAAQEAYDAADDTGKAQILNDRAVANEKKAKDSNDRALALIELAKNSTDPVKAMAYLDEAEQLTQEAQTAADQAKQEREQAEQLLGQNDTPGSGGGTSGVPVQPSRSILEDAASVVDRYTASLNAAVEAASSNSSQPVQFIQNNSSPVALSESEIYRQSKNLLSIAEVALNP